MHQWRIGRTKGLIVLVVLTTFLLAGPVLVGCGADEPAAEPPAEEAVNDGAPDEGAATPEEPAPSEPAQVEGASHTVKQVLDAPVQGERVVLGGEIAEMLTSQDFMLDDGTGEVFVDGDDDFGALAVGDIVLVTGEVDVEDSPARVEIQATAIERK